MLRLATTLLGSGARKGQAKLGAIAAGTAAATTTIGRSQSTPSPRGGSDDAVVAATTAATAVAVTPAAPAQTSRKQRQLQQRGRAASLPATPKVTVGSATVPMVKLSQSDPLLPPRTGPQPMGTCVPFTSLTDLAALLGADTFIPRLGPLTNARCVNALAMDGLKHSGRGGQLADHALMAELVAALQHLEERMAAAAVKPGGRQAVYRAGLAIVVTSAIASQGDADVQAMVLRNALDILGLGTAFKRLHVMVLSKRDSARAMKAKALLFSSALDIDAPVAAAAKSTTTAAADGVETTTKSSASSKSVANRKDEDKKVVAEPAVDETTKKSAATPARRSATPHKVQMATAASGKEADAAADAAAKIAAISSIRSSNASRNDFVSYVSDHYPEDIPTHDYLSCLSDITGLFRLADRKKVRLPSTLEQLRAKRVSVASMLDLGWRPQRVPNRKNSKKDGEDDGKIVLVRPGRASLSANAEATFLRVLAAAVDYNKKVSSGGAYTSAFALEVVKHPLVIVVPTLLSAEEAQVRETVLRLATTNSAQFDNLPVPTFWVMDRATTQQYLPCAYAPRMTELWRRLRAAGPRQAKRERERAKATAAAATPVEVADAAAAKTAKATATTTKMVPLLATTRTSVAAPTAATAAAKAMTATATVAQTPAPQPSVARQTPAGIPAARSESLSAKKPTVAAHVPTMDRERVLWTSPRGQPADPATLLPLLGCRHYARLAAKLSAARRGAVAAAKAARRANKKGKTSAKSSSAADNNASVAALPPPPPPQAFAAHVMVYRLGTTSTLHTAWGGLVESVVRYFEYLTGIKYALPVTAPLSGGRSRRGRTLSSPSRARGGATTRLSSAKAAAAAAAASTMCRGVYALLHVTAPPGSEATMEQLQRELDVMYESLSDDVQQHVLLGVRLVARQQITEANLTLLLQCTALLPVSAAPAAGADGVDSLAVSPQQEQQEQHRKALAAVLAESALDQESIARTENPLFTSIYRDLLGVTEGIGALPSESAVTNPVIGGGSSVSGGVTPGLIVTQSACVAAILSQALQRHEARLQARSLDLVESLQSAQGANEELSRRVQRVELKTMVTDAVEEVSGRHEQATAHLVKSLSAMVSQWSTDKLLDGIDARLKTPLEKIVETLTERELASVTVQRNESVATKAAVQELSRKVQLLIDSRASELAAVNHGTSTVLEKLTPVDSLEQSLKDLRRGFEDAIKEVRDAVRQALSPDMPGLDASKVAELENTIIEELRASSQKSVSAMETALDHQGPMLMDKVEASLHRALVAAAAQGSVSFSSPATAVNDESPTAATEEEEKGTESTEEEKQRQLRLRRAMRRRYAIWQRRIAVPRRRQQLQQQQQQQAAETSDATTTNTADDASQVHGGSLSQEALSSLLREQREEMLWLLQASDVVHHCHHRGGRREKN